LTIVILTMIIVILTMADFGHSDFDYG